MREHLRLLCEKHDITTFTASEASIEAFMEWRELYKQDFEFLHTGTSIEKFDVMSQVKMFDHDLQSLYEDN